MTRQMTKRKKERKKMFEKVNPSHPDKVADRIAGALVDLAYTVQKNPKVAVEVLIGHGKCHIIAESSVNFTEYRQAINNIVNRIVGEKTEVDLVSVLQDKHLADNQRKEVRCGDNGIFKGVPTSDEEHRLSRIAKALYARFKTDGKYIIDEKTKALIVCQSHATNEEIEAVLKEQKGIKDYKVTINPLGFWTGGTSVDTGATNRKLGSDMGRSVTGGGLHGKDLSKADVSVNIYAYLKAQETHKPVELFCAIGDTEIDGKPYGEIVEIARKYIDGCGGFEKFAEWGLI